MIWLAFAAFLYWGCTFSVPCFSFLSALLPVPNLLTSSVVIGVCALCLAIRAAIWAFSSLSLLASFSFVSFSICNCPAFSAYSLLFSFNCFSVSVATFLACNTSFKSHFIAYLGISSLTILSISISSLSGNFCLCFLVLVLGFLLSLFVTCLLANSASFTFCLCF